MTSLPSTPIELELIVEESSSCDAESSLSTKATIKKNRRERHWTMLLLSIFILGAAFALSLRGAKGEEAVAWQGVQLPILCASRAWFGLECPGCGLTRSFVALAAGDLSQSLRYHRVGWLVWLAVVLQLPYRVYSLWELQTSIVQRRWTTWFGNFLIATLLSNWVWNVFS